MYNVTLMNVASTSVQVADLWLPRLEANGQHFEDLL